MSQHNKERHAAAMLVHNIGSGIEALEDLPHELAMENIEALEESYFLFGRIVLRLSEAKVVRDKIRVNQ